MKILRKIIIAIIIFILILVILLFLINIKRNEQYIQNEIKDIDNTVNINSDIVLLEERNIFYTLSTCVDTYTELIAEKNARGLYEILDKEYLQENQINQANILEKLDKFENSQINVVRKVYVKELNGYNNMYYVYYTSRDNIYKQDFDFSQEERTKEKDHYLIIKLDFYNEIFSIIPYQGELFKNNK